MQTFTVAVPILSILPCSPVKRFGLLFFSSHASRWDRSSSSRWVKMRTNCCLRVFSPCTCKWEQNFTVTEVVSWFRQLVAGLWLRRTVLDPRPVHERSVVDKVAVGQVYLRVLRFSPVSIIPPMLHTHLHLHVALNRRTKGRSLGTFEKAVFFRKSQNIGQKSTFTFTGRGLARTYSIT